MTTKVIIVSGVPGSGKSTWLANRYALIDEDKGSIDQHQPIVEKGRVQYPDSVVHCSADSYFIGEDGNYRFDPSKASEAHASCFRQFITALFEPMHKIDYILVDNTNIDPVEIAPYVLAAQAYGALIELITFHGDPVAHWSRNQHGVPVHVVLAMKERLNNRKLPPFWTFRQRMLLDGVELHTLAQLEKPNHKPYEPHGPIDIEPDEE